MRFFKVRLLTAWGIFAALATVKVAAQPIANFTAPDTTACSPFSQVVSFQNLTTGGATSYLWLFGDAANSSSTLATPTFIYNQPGCYDVTLIATNAQGSDTLVKPCFINIYPQPSPGFTIDATQGCAPLTVNITDTTLANAPGITSWVWILTDGSNSNAQNPTFTFSNAPDTISLALTVTNSFGCQAIRIFPDLVTVYEAPDLDFTVSPNSACNPPLAVTVTNTTQLNGGIGPVYNWQFPGGTIPGGLSTFTGATPPAITYAADGQYDISVIVTTANGCRDTVVKDNVVGIGGVTASFTANDQTVCLGEPVTFTNTSVGGVTSVGWNFGQTPGINSTANSPTFTYTAVGTYSVTLQANNPQCGDTVIQTNFIQVLPKPIADFDPDRDQDCKPGVPFNFTDQSVGAATRSWNFGDGTPLSTQTNPTHTFNTFGVFDVCLTVTSSGGCTDTICKQITISPPTAAFTRTPGEGCTPVTVQFTSTSTAIDPIVSYQWNFGTPTATPPTSTTPSQSVTYTVPGEYDVQLIIVTQIGCRDTLLVNNSVRVGTPPQAAFTVDKDTVCINEALTFESTFKDPDWDYYWDFQYQAPGQFTQITDSTTTIYPDTGTYSVALIIDNQGCRDTAIISDLIFVSPPRAEFSVSDSLVCSLPATITFTDESIGPNDIFEWYVNGVLYSTLQTAPPLTITTIGSYLVSQVIENSLSGCKDTFTMAINAGSPVANFVANDTIGCATHNVVFTATPSPLAALYYWNPQFGVSPFYNYNSNPTIAFSYADTGTYSVRLIVFDIFGCRDTMIRTNYINSVGSIPLIGATPSDGCPPLAVQFKDSTISSAAANIVSWVWDFGDGSPVSTLQNPFHTYTTVGDFTVTLTITDQIGCVRTRAFPAAISVTFPIPSFTVDDDSTCAGNPLTFTSTSQGVGLSYVWKFGDGSPPVSGDSVNHPFPAPGSYDITMIATDINGCVDSITYNDFVYVEVFEANFGGFPLTGICPPLSTQFTDSTVGNVASWNWTFGDGFGFSFLQNPGNLYLAPGSYDVRLIATHQDGCRDTLIRPDYVFVAGPNGSFTIEPPNACLGDTLCITAIVTGASCGSFDFRDGVVTQLCGLSGGADTINVCHQYLNPDTYSPVVVLEDLSGCVYTVTTPDSTIIYALPQAIIAPLDTAGCNPLPVQFVDNSIPGDSAIVSWNWDLGDGDSSLVANPFHVYNGDSLFNVTLTIVDQNGCTDTARTTINVYQGTIADFIASDTVGCAPATITFGDLSSNLPPTGWTWDFGDGTTSTGVSNPVHTYQNDGTYTVTLIVSDNLGCADTLVKPNYIRLRHPDAQVYASQTIGCNPITITFYADSSFADRPITQYQWCLTEINTGQQLCSITPANQDSIQISFPVSGEYQMTVEILDALGCSDISDPAPVTVVNRVTPPPIEVRNVTVDSKTSATVSWAVYPGTDFVQYAIYRTNGPSPGQVGIVTDQNTLSFTETNAALNFEGASYCYEVLVQNFCGEYSLSDLTPDHCTINLETTPGTDAITLNWSPYVGYPVVIYEIFRADTYNTGAIQQIGVVSGSELTFTDFETFCYDSISYRVRASGFGGPDQISYSDLDANAPIHPKPTLATDMMVASVVDNLDIEVSWEEYLGYLPSRYLLQRSVDGISWDSIGSFPLNVRNYLDTTVNVNERSYYYRVFGVDECGDRSVVGLLAKTILLDAALDASGKVPQLNWSAYQEWTNGVLTYEVEVRNIVTGLFESVDFVPGNLTLYGDDRTQLSQPEYCYRIKASEVGGNSEISYSNEACVIFGPAIYAPNAFTPNDDGHNDRFLVFAPNIASAELRIYNRWGEMIYLSTDLSEGWDGTFKNRTVQEGVYVFTVKGIGVNSQPVSRSGTVTLIR
ncbi:MAG: PKD domain-containing protein [Bacteroidetes bacterium]|nr:MAG: PKD domain-containing protein [Bacteroidota bacterium]